MFGEIGLLRSKFEGGLIGNVFGCPDLAVRMRIAGAHHGAAVLEDLDVLDFGARSEFSCLCRPHFYDTTNCRKLHGCEGEVVAGIETEDTADATLGLRAQETRTFDIEMSVGHILFECGKVVLEDIGSGVLGRLVATGAGVAGAEVAGGIVGEGLRLCGVLGLALPGAQGAMGGHDDPLTPEGIPAAMWGLEKNLIDHLLTGRELALRSPAFLIHAPSTASQI